MEVVELVLGTGVVELVVVATLVVELVVVATGVVELVVVATGVVELVVVATWVVELVVGLIHPDDPGGDEVPAVQAVHVVAPEAEYVPPLHGVHTLGTTPVVHLLVEKAGVPGVSSEQARQLTGF